MLEDGPEDGLELTPALLGKLIGVEDHGAHISLFVQPDVSEGRAAPYLLGRYGLVEVVGGTATYRWKAG